MNLENLNVVQLSTVEVTQVEGGWWWLPGLWIDSLNGMYGPRIIS